jgi:16S rRNA (guanine527-N7)-methyltransferase
MSAWPGLTRRLNDFAVEHSLSGRPEGNSPYVIDVGSGNGVPGLVLAILTPGLRIYLIEKTSRKAAFLRHAAATLGISGHVFVIAGDVAQVQLDERDGCAIILSRAFAALEDFLDRSWHLSQQQTRWLYMAGRRDQVLGLTHFQGDWGYVHPRRSSDFYLESLETDTALEAERHLVWIRRRAS